MARGAAGRSPGAEKRRGRHTKTLGHFPGSITRKRRRRVVPQRPRTNYPRCRGPISTKNLDIFRSGSVRGFQGKCGVEGLLSVALQSARQTRNESLPGVKDPGKLEPAGPGPKLISLTSLAPNGGGFSSSAANRPSCRAHHAAVGPVARLREALSPAGFASSRWSAASC
jgi:hypothetical protein